MVTMDVKGITWVGHVYEKFEEMCLDMEEIMYKGTIKYVENQVETVGASVKRFYSDVMRDLLPPTAPEVSVKEAHSRSYSRKSNEAVTHNVSNPVVEENTESMNFHSKISDAINPVDVLLSSEVRNENREALRDQICILSSPTNVAASDIMDRMSDKTENANEFMPGISINAADTRENNGSISLILSTNTDIRSNEFSEKDVALAEPGRQDKYDTDTIENNCLERGLETIEQTANVCLEKSCVVVSGDELHFVPPVEGKRRPYKKMIRDAFSSRTRSTRKKEYEQLAVWHGNDAKSRQQSSKYVINADNQPKHEISESEWEVL